MNQEGLHLMTNNHAKGSVKVTAMTSNRELFESSYAEYLKTIKDLDDFYESYATGCIAKKRLEARQKAWKEVRKGKPPEDENKIIDKIGELANKYTEGVEEEAKAIYNTLIAKKAEIELKLNSLAALCEVVSGENEFVFRMTDGWMFSTQGLGAVHYARGLAESHADKARFHGVQAEIKEVQKHADTVFTVMVKLASDIDLEILKRKPEIPLRDWVENCWHRGINPRVMNPFLPYDYEEKNNISFFKKETK